MWIVFVTIIILSIIFVTAGIALTWLFIVGIKNKDWPTMGYAFCMFLLIGLLFLHLLYYGVLGGS
mgnify:FL=1